MTGKMSLKKRLIDRDRFHANAFGSTFIEADDPIDHQKWIPMRQNLHDLISVQSAVALWNNARHGERFSPRLFLRDHPRQFRVGRMPRFDRDQVATNSATDQRKVAHNVENLVPDEFVLETQWLLAQDRIAAHNDRVFKAATLDEIFFHQRLDI